MNDLLFWGQEKHLITSRNRGKFPFEETDSRKNREDIKVQLPVHEELLIPSGPAAFLEGSDFKITSISAGVRIKDLSSCNTLY